MRIDKNIHESMTERWNFNEQVVEVFDDMLNRSIPQLDEMRSLVTAYGREFVKPGSTIIDLGSSKGASIDAFLNEFGTLCRYILIENSDPMYRHLRHKYLSDKTVEPFRMNLNDTYPQFKNDLTLAVLTLQFTEPEQRRRIIEDVATHINEGGAFIIVEKTCTNDELIQNIFTKQYEDMKIKNGYSRDEIEQKKVKLKGVLQPIADWETQWMLNCNFRMTQQVWRWNQFVMWVCVR